MRVWGDEGVGFWEMRWWEKKVFCPFHVSCVIDSPVSHDLKPEIWNR